MLAFARTLVFLLLLPGAASAVDKDTPFAASLTTPSLSVAPGGTAELVVRYEVYAKHYLYRDMSGVSPLDGGGLTVGEGVFPPGKTIFDPVSEVNREIYEGGFEVRVPVTVAADAAPGKHAVKLQVKWQGCNKPENYCLFPVKQAVVAQVVVAARQGHWVEDLVRPALAAGGSSRAKEPSVDFSGLPASADVQEVGADDEAHPVRARLVADQTALVPGGTLRLGVHLEPETNWHTYWRSPGDIGLPTKIRWALPEGATSSAFEFPVPERFDQEGIVSYGYDGPVMLFTEITLPAELPPGEVLLGAQAEWLVCEIMCIRGEAELQMSLPVAEGSLPSAHAPLFDHYAGQHPTPIDQVQGFTVEAALSTSAVRPEETFQFAIQVKPTGDQPIKLAQSHGTWPGFTPIVKLNGMLDGVVVLPLDSGEIAIVVTAETFEADPLPTDDVLGGLLAVQVGDETVYTELTMPVPWAAAGAAVARSDSPLFGAAPKGDVLPAAEPSTGAVAGVTAAAGTGGALEFLYALWLAFLGGLVLNVMPCVLPVLTMKLYSLIGQVNTSSAERRSAGYAYSAGILVSFLALAVALIVVKVVLGEQVGWGFQSQSPVYNMVLVTIVFAFGLSLFGVFEVPAFGANRAAAASAKEGVSGYFLTGVFATLLATPCSAPFLSVGMGFGLALPPAGILLFFAVAGFGLAFPFLLIALVPALYRFLPKPGAWMDTFKQLMAFCLMATAVWLVHILSGQLSREAVTGLLAFLFFVALALWTLGRFGAPTEEPRRQMVVAALALVIAVGGGTSWLSLEVRPSFTGVTSTDQALDFTDEIPWQPFSQAQVEAYAGKTLFIDFTADWCLTCKVNEKTVLAQASVRGSMDELGVIPLKADWTNRDATITQWLQRFGRAGVPFYLVMPADAGAEPIPLPDIITPDLVIQALKQGVGQT